MSNFDKITAVIIVKNGASTIRACLDSLNVFHEVVVVIDDATTDMTMDVCNEYQKVRSYAEKFSGFGAMKQRAVSLANSDWIFSLDADEIASQPLIHGIGGLDLGDKNLVYAVKRNNHYKGRHIDGCGWNNDYPIRIFNRVVTNFNDNKVHEAVRRSAPLKVLKLEQPILHYAYNNEAELKQKSIKYAELYAEQNHKIVQPFFFTPYLKGIFTFFRSYILQHGWMYGKTGFLISKYQSYGTFLKYEKLRQLNDRS